MQFPTCRANNQRPPRLLLFRSTTRPKGKKEKKKNSPIGPSPPCRPSFPPAASRPACAICRPVDGQFGHQSVANRAQGTSRSFSCSSLDRCRRIDSRDGGLPVQIKIIIAYIAEPKTCGLRCPYACVWGPVGWLSTTLQIFFFSFSFSFLI